MADNVVLNTGSGGESVATDDIGGIQYQIVKLAFGALDTANLVTSTGTNPLPVALSDTDNAVLDTIDSVLDTINTKLVTGTVIGDVNLGAVDNAVLDAIDAVLDTINAKLVSGTDIGDVDILSIATGDNNIGNVDIVSLPASTNTLEVVGDAAHAATIAGNPVSIGGVSQDMDDTAPPNRTGVVEGEACRIATDFDGGLFAHPHGPQVWSYHADGTSALTDASVHADPGVGLSIYITDIVCSTGAATALNIFFEESTTKVLGPWYLEAVAGRGLSLHLQTPKKVTANTAVTVTTSAAIAHSVDVTGFIGQG